MDATYVIRNARTGEMIECHDIISREYGERKVKNHNALCGHMDKWTWTMEHQD